jgi:hypothetical protein
MLFDQLPISVFGENDDLVVAELIAIRLIYHDVSPFLADAFRDLPKTKMAQSELTDWAWFWFMATNKRPPALCLYVVNLTSVLFQGFGLRIRILITKWPYPALC